MSSPSHDVEATAAAPSSEPKAWRARLAAIALGALCFLVVTELLLRILGVYVAGRSLGMHHPEGRHVILCVGDSMTWGAGAPVDKSWPRQLEDQLWKLKPGAYAVYNRAIASTNTSQLLERLQSHLDELHPELVIVLSGVANMTWNDYGNPCYHERPVVAMLNRWLYRFRTFKLARLLYLDTCQAIEASAGSRRIHAEAVSRGLDAAACVIRARQCASDPDTALAWLDEATRLGAHDVYLYLGYAQAWRLRMDRAKVLESTQRAEACGVADPWVQLRVADLYLFLYDRPKATLYYQQALATPQTAGEAACGLGRLCATYGEYAASRAWFAQAQRTLPTELRGEAERQLQMAEKRDALNASRPYLLDSWFDKLLVARRDFVAHTRPLDERQQWVERDLRTIVDKVRSQGAQVLFMNYLGESTSFLLEEVANEKHVPLVDHEAVFRALPNRATYYAADAHCNAEGYALMARTVLPHVLRMLPPDAAPIRLERKAGGPS